MDDCDYDALACFDWYCLNPPHSKTCYAVRNRPGGGLILMHRVIVEAPEEMSVDHIDGNGLNNVRDNLRLCSHKQNIRAQRPQTGCSSKYRGVSWHKKRENWYSRIKVDG